MSVATAIKNKITCNDDVNGPSHLLCNDVKWAIILPYPMVQHFWPYASEPFSYFSYNFKYFKFVII